MASIQKKNGTFYVIYDYYIMEGTKEVRKHRWEPFENEVDAKVRKAEVELQKAKRSFINPSEITVREFFDKWLPIHARRRWSYSTLTTNQTFVNNHICPLLGDIPLQRLTTMDIEELYDVLRQRMLANPLADRFPNPPFSCSFSKHGNW